MTAAGGTWTSLASIYDRLFPPGRAQLDFIATVLARMPHPARRLLDVGCATGGYALALARLGYEVTGIDLSSEMIRLAQGKTTRWPSDPRFLVADMTDLTSLAADARPPFEGAICLGNTLAHMLSAAELGTALGEMARVLVPDGRAILQTVNYDRLAATGVMTFPPIFLEVAGVEGVVFHRLYEPRADGLLTFVTSLQDTGSGSTVYRAEAVLRPVAREELATMAEMAFHGPVEVYGDFLFSPWSEASPATVVVATRGWD